MATNTSRIRGWVIGLVGAGLAAVATAAVPVPDPFGSAERARVVPPPASDLAAADATSQVAVFAGGCFWGVQGVYQHVKGVTSAVSGYAGGNKGRAHYETVGGGDSGHAEAVQITFDPRQVSYGALLQIFFSVAHDPTAAQSPGAGRRDAVPVGDLPGRREAGRGRQGLHRAVERSPRLRRADRHDHRAGSAVLSGRGLPPGLPHAASRASPTSPSTTCPRSTS